MTETTIKSQTTTPLITTTTILNNHHQTKIGVATNPEVIGIIRGNITTRKGISNRILGEVTGAITSGIHINKEILDLRDQKQELKRKMCG